MGVGRRVRDGGVSPGRGGLDRAGAGGRLLPPLTVVPLVLLAPLVLQHLQALSVAGLGQFWRVEGCFGLFDTQQVGAECRARGWAAGGSDACAGGEARSTA